MKTKEELIQARKDALDKMIAISSGKDFVQANYDAAKQEVDALTAQIETLDIQANLRSKVDDVLPSDNNKKDEKMALNALMAYVKTGVIDPQNAVTIGGSSNGVVLIPEQYAGSIITELGKSVAMRKHATVIKTNGTYNLPIGGATPTFAWIDEAGTYPTPDLTFTNKSLEAFKAGAIITVSEELLNDESFNLESHLREQAVEGLTLAEGTAFISGDGIKKPKGISKDITIVQSVSATDVITLADVENLYLAVPPKARMAGVWIISDKLYKAIFRMKDSTGNYILRDGANGLPSTIMGRPFEIDDTMLATAQEPLAIFGKISDYNIGDRGEMGIQRLVEKFADEGLVGFKLYKRTDGKLAITKNVAMLKNI